MQGATKADIDKAVAAADHAYRTVWGVKTPGFERARLLHKLADLWEAHMDELAAIEALDGGACPCDPRSSRVLTRAQANSSSRRRRSTS